MLALSPTESVPKEGEGEGEGDADYPPRPNLRIRTPRSDDDEIDLEQGIQKPCYSFYYSDSSSTTSTAYEFNAQRRRELADTYVIALALCLLPCVIAFYSENPLYLLWLLLTLPICLRSHFRLFFTL